jgi:hypothetical protein
MSGQPELPKLLPFPDRYHVPAELLPWRRFCAGKLVWDESKSKYRKPPYSPVIGVGVGPIQENAEHFLPFDEAAAGTRRHGLPLMGMVFFKEDGLVFIDIDDAYNQEGVLEPDVKMWLRWFPSAWIHKSPSGTGLHLIGRGKIPKNLNAVPLSKTSPATIEMYGWDHYATLTGELLSSEGESLPPGVLPPLVDIQVGVSKLWEYVVKDGTPASGPEAEGDGETRPMSRFTARKIHEDNLQALREAEMGQGNALLNSVCYFAGRLFAAGGFDDETADAVKKVLFGIVTVEWPHQMEKGEADATIGSGWNSGVAKPLVLDDKWPEVTKTMEELNKAFFAVNNFGGKFRVCHLTPSPLGKQRIIIAQSSNDFHQRYCNQLIKAGENKNGEPKLEDKATVWLRHKHRRTYEKIVFKPEGPVARDEMNLWEGFAVEPKKGDCGRYLVHVRENICQGEPEKYDWLIKWMAWQVRNPGKVGESAIAVYGLKGTGKNCFAEGFCELWGRHGMVVDNPRQATGNFNAHLRDKCCLVCDEAFFAKDPNQAERLKTIITGKTLKIEAKGIDTEEVPNLLRLIIIGNNEHLVNATWEERRFLVLRCGEKQQKNTAYFAALKNQLDAGGYSALLYHLLREVDLSGFDVRNPPHTKELERQVASSLRGVERVWFDILQTGALPGYERLPDGSVKLRAADLAEWANTNGVDRWERITEEAVGNFLGTDPRALRPTMGLEKKREPNKGRCYRVIPPLVEARKRWEKLRGSGEWPRVSGQGELQGEEWELRRPVAEGY